MIDQTTHHAEAILRAAGSSLRHYEPRTREAILAAVREAVGEWLPIDSHPKDGSGFMVDCPHVTDGVSMMTWEKGRLVSLFDGKPWCAHLSPPKFWRPLPTPPRGE